MPTNYPNNLDEFIEPLQPETTPLSQAGSGNYNHVQSHTNMGDAIEALQANASLKSHDHSGDPGAGPDRVRGYRLKQANTHEAADTDIRPTSIHHTLGLGANQAAAGNHNHDYNTLLNVPYRLCTSTTRPTGAPVGTMIYESDTNRVRAWSQFTPNNVAVTGVNSTDRFDRVNPANMGSDWSQLYTPGSFGVMATPDGNHLSWTDDGNDPARCIARRVKPSDMHTLTDNQIITWKSGGTHQEYSPLVGKIARHKLFTLSGTAMPPWAFLQAQVGRGVRDDLWEWDPIWYPAFFPVQTSLAIGIANVLAAIDAWPGKFGLCGYSQGAMVAASVLWELRHGSHQHRLPDLIGAVTFGNPYREAGHTFPGGIDPGGSGMAPDSGLANGRIQDTPDLWWDFANSNLIPGCIGADPFTTNPLNAAGEDITAVFQAVTAEYNGNSYDLHEHLVDLFGTPTVEENQAVIDALVSVFSSLGVGHMEYIWTKPLPGSDLTSVELGIQHLNEVGLATPPRYYVTGTTAPSNDFYFRMSDDETSYLRLLSSYNQWGQGTLSLYATRSGPGAEQMIGSISADTYQDNTYWIAELVGDTLSVSYGPTLTGSTVPAGKIIDRYGVADKGASCRGWGVGMVAGNRQLLDGVFHGQVTPGEISLVTIQDAIYHVGSALWQLLPVASVPIVRLRQSMAQQILAAGTYIQWADELEDNFGFFNPIGSSSINIGEPGLYHLDVAIQWNARGVPEEGTIIACINGVETDIRNSALQKAGTPSSSAGFSQTLALNGKIRLAANDVLSIKVKHSSSDIINQLLSYFDGPSKVNSRMDLIYASP